MDGNFSHCNFCDGRHEAYDCPEVVIPAKLVARVQDMSPRQVADAINKNHPVEADDDLNYTADTLAMELIHGRHDKREIVNLIRWCLMGCPVAKPEKTTL